jgi:hypothetical protein
MAVISKGIKLFNGEKELTNLQQIADLGGTAESIEITCLADPAHMYTDGILNYGDSLEFTFLYEKAQFIELNNLEGSQSWKVELPDATTCSFSGTCSVKLSSVGVNAALTYVLAIKPDSAMVWA